MRHSKKPVLNGSLELSAAVADFDIRNTSEAAPIVGYSDNTTPFMVLMTVALAGAGAAGAHAFARSREE